MTTKKRRVKKTTKTFKHKETETRSRRKEEEKKTKRQLIDLNHIKIFQLVKSSHWKRTKQRNAKRNKKMIEKRFEKFNLEIGFYVSNEKKRILSRI